MMGSAKGKAKVSMQRDTASLCVRAEHAVSSGSRALISDYDTPDDDQLHIGKDASARAKKHTAPVEATGGWCCVASQPATTHRREHHGNNDNKMMALLPLSARR